MLKISRSLVVGVHGGQGRGGSCLTSVAARSAQVSGNDPGTASNNEVNFKCSLLGCYDVPSSCLTRVAPETGSLSRMPGKRAVFHAGDKSRVELEEIL